MYLSILRLKLTQVVFRRVRFTSNGPISTKLPKPVDDAPGPPCNSYKTHDIVKLLDYKEYKLTCNHITRGLLSLNGSVHPYNHQNMWAPGRTLT